MNGQTERVNQLLDDILRAFYLDYWASWVELLPLIYFSNNNSC